MRPAPTKALAPRQSATFLRRFEASGPAGRPVVLEEMVSGLTELAGKSEGERPRARPGVTAGPQGRANYECCRSVFCGCAGYERGLEHCSVPNGESVWEVSATAVHPRRARCDGPSFAAARPCQAPAAHTPSGHHIKLVVHTAAGCITRRVRRRSKGGRGAPGCWAGYRVPRRGMLRRKKMGGTGGSWGWQKGLDAMK